LEEEQPAKIADLYSKCSELAAQQEREMSRLVGVMLPVLEFLDQPIGLRPASLGGSFPGLRSAVLQGSVVVTTDVQGRVASRPLVKLETAELLAVLKGVFPELQRLVADKKRAASVRPILSMRLVLGGQRFIVDTRSYRLVVSNSGGDCRGLRISAELADGRNKDYRERDLSRGARTEVDLGVLKEVKGAESLKLGFECKDVDGLEYCGAEALRLDGERLQEAALSLKSSSISPNAR
jgi:hypothetical protein